MALIPVRSKEPVNGETFVTEVGAEHLERWPDDYEPLEGDELLAYELKKAGVPDEHLDEALKTAADLASDAERAASGAVGLVPTGQDPDGSGESLSPAV